MRFAILFLCFAVTFSVAQKNNAAAAELATQQLVLDSLKKEVDALKRIKLEKANQLEKAETVRWQNRYSQNRATQEYQNETRLLEGRYAKISDDLSRAATELGSLRNLAIEQKERSVAVKNNLDNFYLLVKQAVDKNTEEIPQDFPAKMEERLLNFADNPPDIETFFKDRLHRLSLTASQEFSAKDTYRLRLGTVFYVDAGTLEAGDVSAVLRTGALQGKIFEWRNTLSKELSAEMQKTVLDAKRGAELSWIPVDILQTKSIMGVSAGTSTQTISEKFIDWFKTGGIVMYPLSLVAIASLLIGLERGFILWRWGHISKTFTKKLHTLLKNNQINDAKELCKKQKTCLGKMMGTIVNNFENGKEQAQKVLQRTLLSEQSDLEKRMNFLASLGSVAPLVGLLGTVTGMITLFNAITQAGTNDARILAGGISEALITTEAGLIIAIPVMLLHGKLSETLDFVTAELRIQSLALLHLLWKEG